MKRPTSPPDPPLSDGVVTLRRWHADDAPALAAAFEGDEELGRWIDRLPQPFTDDDARAEIELGERGWLGDARDAGLAVIDAETGRLLGGCRIYWHNPDEGVAGIGYWTAREARGRGVASRTVRILAGWILGELEYERLEIEADTRNEPSLRVAERVGFRFEGVIRSARSNARDGRRVDHALYSLLRSELDR